MKHIHKTGKPPMGIILFLIISLLGISNITPIYAADIELVNELVGNEDSGKFSQPGALFFDEEKQRLYIADTGNSRLVSYDANFLPLADFDANGKLKFPSSVIRNDSGQFYLIAGKKKEIIFIDLGKKVFKTLTITGAPKKANPIIPGRLAIDKEQNLYVTDKGNGRILKISKTGKFEKEIIAGKKSVDFSDIRVDSKGNIFSLSTIQRKVYIFNKSGTLVKTFGKKGKEKDEFLFPVSIAVDSVGYIFVLDQHKGNVGVYNKKGEYQYNFSEKGVLPGQLYTPSHIFLDNKGLIYIADRGNDRIQVFKH